MCCPLWMHPPDVDLLVFLHPAQSESVQTATCSDSCCYLCQLTTLVVSDKLSSQPDEFAPVIFGGRRHSLRCFPSDQCDVHPAKKFALAAILLYLVTSSQLSMSPSSSFSLHPSLPLNLRSFKSCLFSFSVSRPRFLRGRCWDVPLLLFHD